MGSARYWSWLFAASAARAAASRDLCAAAEWNALMDPATEHSGGSHQVGNGGRKRFAVSPPEPRCTPLGLSPSLPRAGEVSFTPWALSIDAAVTETDGAPLDARRSRASCLRPACLPIVGSIPARQRRSR